jgi:hypothetical protein
MVSNAMDHGISAMTAATVFGVAGIGSLGGKILCGLIADRIGAKRMILIGLTAQATAIALYTLIGSAAAFYALALGFGFSYGGVMPLYAIVVREYFGAKIMGTVFGALGAVATLGMAIGPVAGGFFYDSFGSYFWLFAGSAGIGLGAVAIAATFRPPQPVQVPLPTAEPGGLTRRARDALHAPHLQGRGVVGRAHRGGAARARAEGHRLRGARRTGGFYLGGERLQGTDTTTMVRIKDGRPLNHRRALRRDQGAARRVHDPGRANLDEVLDFTRHHPLAQADSPSRFAPCAGAPGRWTRARSPPRGSRERAPVRAHLRRLDPSRRSLVGEGEEGVERVCDRHPPDPAARPIRAGPPCA